MVTRGPSEYSPIPLPPIPLPPIPLMPIPLMRAGAVTRCPSEYSRALFAALATARWLTWRRCRCVTSSTMPIRSSSAGQPGRHRLRNVPKGSQILKAQAPALSRDSDSAPASAKARESRGREDPGGRPGSLAAQAAVPARARPRCSGSFPKRPMDSAVKVAFARARQMPGGCGGKEGASHGPR